MNPNTPDHWKLRALRAAREDGLLSAILRVMVGRPAFQFVGSTPVYGVLPGFGPRFRIDESGLVIATQVNADGAVTHNVVICDTDDLRSNLNRLGDTIRATDDERGEMFSALRSVIYDDLRSITDPDDPLSRVQRKL